MNDLVYLEHGAHWAILTLAFLILASIKWEIGEVVTGLLGAVFIILSLFRCVIYNRNHKKMTQVIFLFLEKKFKTQYIVFFVIKYRY